MPEPPRATWDAFPGNDAQGPVSGFNNDYHFAQYCGGDPGVCGRPVGPIATLGLFEGATDNPAGNVTLSIDANLGARSRARPYLCTARLYAPGLDGRGRGDSALITWPSSLAVSLRFIMERNATHPIARFPDGLAAQN